MQDMMREARVHMSHCILRGHKLGLNDAAPYSILNISPPFVVLSPMQERECEAKDVRSAVLVLAA